MKLSELNPKLEGTVEKGVVVFDCPKGKHRLGIPIHSQGYVDGIRHWQASGTFPDTLTLTPSINETHNDPNTGEVVFQCWHGFITNGEVV